LFTRYFFHKTKSGNFSYINTNQFNSMADLDVQPKKKSPVMWIILVIVVLALIFLLMRGRDGSETTTQTSSDTTALPQNH